MPSDDLILNVRQLAGYPTAATTGFEDALLIQRGGLGGPYYSIAPPDFVGTALANGGDMAIDGSLSAESVTADSATLGQATVSSLGAQSIQALQFDAQSAAILGLPIATESYVNDAVAGTVWSFEGRRGDVCLWINDILRAGGAPIFSPVFGGFPRAPTPSAKSNSTRIATTEFVQRNSVLYINNLLATHPFVFTFNGRSGDVVLTNEDLQGAAEGLLDSPAFSGVPTAPTAPPLTDSTQLATTAYVDSAVAAAATQAATIYAPINSPAFTGYATSFTPPAGDATGRIATTAFVMNAVADSVAGVASFNTRTGNVTLEADDITNADGALINSPVFTGTPQAPTAAPGTATAQIATCAWVMNELGGIAAGVDTFNGRSGAVVLTSADLTGAGGALLSSPAFSGVPTAPTAPTNTSTNQLATTAFVMSAVTQGSVSSFNGRVGAVTLTAADVSAAGGLANPSPNLTGSPTAPTQAASTNNTTIATTAYVTAAVAALPASVSSFNGRTGAVTFTATDLTNAGGATQAFVNTAIAAYLPLAGGTLTGPLTMTGASPTLALNKSASGGAISLSGETNGVLRWVVILGNATAESGANAGSNFAVNAYSDAGAVLGNALTITRSNMAVGFGAGFLVNAVLGVINNASGMNYSGTNGMVVENFAGNPCYYANRSSNGAIHSFLQSGTSCGSITVANANSTAFNTTSDARLKDDERPFDPWAYIEKINVYDFRFKSGGPRRHGVMAQEVDPVYPEAVAHDEKKDWWGVDYSKFVPLLLQAVKDLQARIAQLEAA